MFKILCLIDSLGMGGAERQMIGLAALLKQKGIDVEIVTYYPQNSYSELLQKYDIGVTVLKTRHNKLCKLFTIYRHIKGSGGYDWIIAYKDGACLIGCLLKMLLNVKLIVSERSMNRFVSNYDKIKFFLYKWADYVVPNSFSQENFIKRNFPYLEKRLVTITNYTDTDMFFPINHSRGHQLIIVTVARISRAKNIINYLKSIRLLKDAGIDNVKFEWYGNVQKGEEEYGEEVFQTKERLNISDVMTFFPATSNVVECSQRADVFCLPSIYEGFSNVICEAMSCGKPIVCGRVSDNPHIVQDEINGLLFDPNDVEDIAAKLKHIICKPEQELLSWGLKSREISLELFSKDKFVSKYLNLMGITEP